jgi:transcriptional regulator with XRE-family HTH domain
MSQAAFAETAGGSSRTILDFEAGKRQPIKATLAAIQMALEAAGVEFTNGGQPGVRMASANKRKRS